MEKRYKEIFATRNGRQDLDSRSDFCFVAQSFQHQVNIGTLLRCADAGMAREVVAVGRKGWSRCGAMGASGCVPYRHFHTPRAAIDYLKSSGMSIVVVEKDSRSVSLFDCVYSPRPAFVLGNEVYGVYPDFLEAADLIVEIPMYGMINSLNVAVTGAVVMYDYLQKKSKGARR